MKTYIYGTKVTADTCFRTHNILGRYLADGIPILLPDTEARFCETGIAADTRFRAYFYLVRKRVSAELE